VPVPDRSKERAYDAYLVASARLGDRAATSELAARWQPRLLAHAWRLTGDGELARDMAQEAWLEILRGLSRLNDVAASPAWALRILTRRCAKAIRRRQRRRDSEAALAREPAAASVDGAETQAHSADIRALRTAIAELPGPQRAALALFYLEEMSVAEIAVALGLPGGTVKTRLMHARRLLRDKLEGEDHDEHR